MAHELQHLDLRELTLRPGGEWSPPHSGWAMARVAEGVAYLMGVGEARELKAGDVFVTPCKSGVVLRASQLESLKLQFFVVQPDYLSGLLSVAEQFKFKALISRPARCVFVFLAGDAIAQKFARVVSLSLADEFSLRCILVQIWSGAVSGWLRQPVAESGVGNVLKERFRELVGRMTEAELAQESLAHLAGQLHCSERHFNRLFREEFGLPLRKHQTELRLQRARHLLAESDGKIIEAAYDSGYRHLGLFNSMFKKRFGVTPSQWRQKNRSGKNSRGERAGLSAAASFLGAVLLISGLFFSNVGIAQVRPSAPGAAPVSGSPSSTPAATNAGPRFRVDKYLIMGDSILPPQVVSRILTNVPNAFGTNVTFEGIQAALGDLQMAYRERGYVTVSVGLPPQKLTNGVVKVKVTEAPLAAITVTGNRWYSTENVLRAVPGLRTNMLLNSHVFQRELDVANASRDRQIYPVIGPGPEPGTSALTLKVKDQFPLHGRTELNNQSTPGTPQLRENSSVQYNNLWNQDHQVGLQYSFTPEQWKANDYYNKTPLDSPLIANYSGYYRIPLTSASSVEREVQGNPAIFGYNETTRKFNLPPSTSRPELNLYASRSTSETGVKNGPSTIVVDNPPGLVITSQDSGDNLTLNSGLGGRLSLPLRPIAGVSSTLSAGLDYKSYESASYNTNNFYAVSVYKDTSGNYITNTAATHSGQPTRYSTVNYLPLNLGLNSSVPDSLGITFFNATLNFNPFTAGSGNAAFSQNSYSTNARANYVTLLSGLSRDQELGQGWTLRMHADGQWASTPLISNEQFALGGMSGVRGYSEGEVYGDTGWRLTLEPRTPQVNIGMVDGDIPFWVRGLAFVDYGQVYRLDASPGSTANEVSLLGVGGGVTANIGSHLDARLTLAWPLLTDTASPAGASAGSLIVYFGLGAQF